MANSNQAVLHLSLKVASVWPLYRQGLTDGGQLSGFMPDRYEVQYNEREQVDKRGQSYVFPWQWFFDCELYKKHRWKDDMQVN